MKFAPKRAGAAERANCGVAEAANNEVAGLANWREKERANTILKEAAMFVKDKSSDENSKVGAALEPEKR